MSDNDDDTPLPLDEEDAYLADPTKMYEAAANLSDVSGILKAIRAVRAARNKAK